MEEKWAEVNQAGGSTVPTCYPLWDQPCHRLPPLIHPAFSGDP